MVYFSLISHIATALNSEPKRFEFSPKDLTPKENEKPNQKNDKILAESKETVVFSEQQNINQNVNKRRMNFFRKTQISVVNEDEAEIEAEMRHLTEDASKPMIGFEKTSLESTTLEEKDSNIATCPAALLPTITPILGYILMIYLLLIATLWYPSSSIHFHLSIA